MSLNKKNYGHLCIRDFASGAITQFQTQINFQVTEFILKLKNECPARSLKKI